MNRGESECTRDHVSSLVEQRLKFRREKNYEQADIIKRELLDMDISLADTKDGTEFEIQI
ncbi:MAG TPA: hypothetical protein PK127_03785 [Clostridiales bacterium]|nr:hypothetical protein [Clostridiales bacterium]